MPRSAHDIGFVSEFPYANAVELWPPMTWGSDAIGSAVRYRIARMLTETCGADPFSTHGRALRQRSVVITDANSDADQ